MHDADEPCVIISLSDTDLHSERDMLKKIDEECLQLTSILLDGVVHN